jgi:hypothetical protein
VTVKPEALPGVAPPGGWVVTANRVTAPTDPSFTATGSENGEVLLPASVAVAVTDSPVGTTGVKVPPKVACPPASVVAVREPRYRSPWPPPSALA